MEYQLVVDFECHTGESPIWHPEREVYYWIDIPTGRLFSHDPASGESRHCYEGDPLRAVTIQRNGDVLLFEETGGLVYWDGEVVDTADTNAPTLDSYRFNDVIADPEGRVFCGIMPEDDRQGALYRLEHDRSLTPLVDGLEFPNGLGFSPDNDHLYVTDSFANSIYRCDYDRKSGNLSDRQLFATTESDDGVPDGLTVDSAGNVWSARWNGGRIVVYSPHGSRMSSTQFPARKVTSVAFGGREYRTGLVTTALAGSSDPIGSKDAEGDGAGAVFHVQFEAVGTTEYRSAIQ